MPRVERLDTDACRIQDLGVVRQRLGGRVAKVAQDREVDVRVDVAERLDFEMGDELVDPLPRSRASSAR